MHRLVAALAHFFAILGGLVLSALVFLTCLSVLGRLVNTMLHTDVVQSVAPGIATALLAIGIGPINGDFEIVEAGMAFTIFAFLPLCQLSGAHASVDILTDHLPPRVFNAIRLLIECVFAAVLLLIALQLFAGMQSKRASGQTSFLLQYPVWWGYAISVPGAIMAAFVSVYLSCCRLLEISSGKNILTQDSEIGS